MAPTHTFWRLSRRRVRLDRARIMAILNLTPDSFSDGGVLATPADAVAAAQRAIDDGADILDLGGESTRPGSEPVAEPEQIHRVIPALRAIRAAGIEAPVTIDTTRAAVARAALDAGADGVNDVSAGLDDPAMLPLLAERGAGVVLMHRRVAPARDRYSDAHATEPDYGPRGVVVVVRDALRARLQAALDAGIAPDAVALDPGLGFGKSVRQNGRLMAGLGEIAVCGAPVVVGASRKSFLGAGSEEPDPRRRVPESLAAAALMRRSGAAILRVHDVPEHRRALAVVDAVFSA